LRVQLSVAHALVAIACTACRKNCYVCESASTTQVKMGARAELNTLATHARVCVCVIYGMVYHVTCATTTTITTTTTTHVIHSHKCNACCRDAGAAAQRVHMHTYNKKRCTYNAGGVRAGDVRDVSGIHRSMIQGVHDFTHMTLYAYT
jgi:hypothetical protein